MLYELKRNYFMLLAAAAAAAAAVQFQIIVIK
jgi:hypothetical protein